MFLNFKEVEGSLDRRLAPQKSPPHLVNSLIFYCIVRLLDHNYQPTVMNRSGYLPWKAGQSGMLYWNRMPEREMPEWAQRERLSDMVWIAENLSVFWPAASRMFAEAGRGALVVDTSVRVGESEGHPFGYIPQDLVEEEMMDEDVERMLRNYNPEREIVVVLLKSQGRVSSYRIQAGVPGPSASRQ